jgi:hypothetical protein
MYVFLLVLGAVTSLAGMSLVASGVSSHQGDVDTALITSGTIAFVGGLILIGLGLAVNVLQRIELVLTARPMPRPARPNEAAAAPAPVPVVDRPNQPARIPFPPKPKTEPRPQPAPLGAVPAPAENGSFEHLREKFPNLARLENAPAVEETDVSLLPRPSASDEELSVVPNGHANGHANGGAPARTAPRPEAKPRPVRAPEPRKTSLFESLWPKGARAGRDAQAPVADISTPPPPEPEQRLEPVPESPPAPVQQLPMPVSILKSGVVDGMAYTLYSDGSIEAQLPQGILRFGSITELRNHIEQGS